MRERVAFYIDGFNLYHAIDDLGVDYLKWNSLWDLAQGIIQSRSQSLLRSCTAQPFIPAIPESASGMNDTSRPKNTLALML